MQAVTLTIGDRQFRLRMMTDLAEFSDRLTEAVRSGGGMVDIPVATEGRVTALVSPGVVIVLESHEVDAAATYDPAMVMPWIAADDLEY